MVLRLLSLQTLAASDFLKKIMNSFRKGKCGALPVRREALVTGSLYMGVMGLVGLAQIGGAHVLLDKPGIKSRCGSGSTRLGVGGGEALPDGPGVSTACFPWSFHRAWNGARGFR